MRYCPMGVVPSPSRLPEVAASPLCLTRSRERAHSLCDSSSQVSSARTTLLVKQRADYSFFAGPLRVGDFEHGHCVRGWLNSELELDV